MFENNIEQQRKDFSNLLAQLKAADTKEIEQALFQREVVNPEPELTPDVINRLKTKIKNDRL